MFNKSELQIIDLCLMVQISEIKEKLKYYKACRMYERVNGLRAALTSFEAIREKVAHLAEETEQLTVTKI